MKKLVTMSLALIVGAAVTAQTLVYDYKASIKMATGAIKQLKYTESSAKVSGYFDTYSVKSHSLAGYLLVDACSGCNGEMVQSDPEDVFNDAWLYVARKGEKLVKPAVMRVPAGFAAGGFGPNVGAKENGTPTDVKKITDAWGYLTYAIPYAGMTKTITVKKMSEDVNYGFMGYFTGAGWLEAAGFGKLSTDVVEDLCIPSICDDPEIISGYSCLQVKTLNGAVVGMFDYYGLCWDPGIFDICTVHSILEASVYGNWSIKLNKKMSGSFDVAESNVAKKMNTGFFYGDPELVPEVTAYETYPWANSSAVSASGK